MKTSTLIKIFLLALILIVFAVLFNLQVKNWNEARVAAMEEQMMVYKTDQTVESMIKDIANNYFQDGTLNKIEEMDAIHLNSPKFSRVEGSGILSYQEDRNLERQFYSDRKLLSYNISNHKVDVFDDMAISSFHVDLNTVSGNDTLEINAKATIVFIEYDRDWKVVHKHFSPRG
ncbi:MAG: SnoaL-like domain-containing protein [Saprospiraceae bacterium]|nr:SnoaL-like domain-containing protein [Saprospiraceae bacterium]